MASPEPAVRAMISSFCRQCFRSAVSRPGLPASSRLSATRRLAAGSRTGSSWSRVAAAAATAGAAPTAAAAQGVAAPNAGHKRGVGQRTGGDGLLVGRNRSSGPVSSPQRRFKSESAAAVAGGKDAIGSSGSRSKVLQEEEKKVLLRPDDLFHSFSDSPIADMRRRAAFIKMHAYCPHPHHHQQHQAGSSGSGSGIASAESGEPAPEEASSSSSSSVLDRFEGSGEAPAHVDFECPDCGVPVYCSEEHWMDDYEAHLQVCDTLRQINEDDHDLRSGRAFPEFDYPGPQMEEALVNMTNWDTFMYTRGFAAVNDDRSMRQVTRLLTYPVTIASVLHELSPYNIRKGGQLTTEGLKSLSALRYTLHPPKAGESDGIKGLRPQAPAVRLFILGARAESSLPRDVWVQLAHLFPRARLHVILIGPEAMTNRDDEFPLPARTAANPFGAVVEDRIWSTMKISTIVDYFHTVHQTGYFYPYDPYFDCFVLFHPGLGHPASSHEWHETVPMLLETKAPVLVTGYTQYDMERDIAWVHQAARGEFDLLMEPSENIFRSLRWDLNDLDPQDISCGNWGLWAFRGKRYEATRKEET